MDVHGEGQDKNKEKYFRKVHFLKLRMEKDFISIIIYKIYILEKF